MEISKLGFHLLAMVLSHEDINSFNIFHQTLIINNPKYVQIPFLNF